MPTGKMDTRILQRQAGKEENQRLSKTDLLKSCWVVACWTRFKIEAAVPFRVRVRISVGVFPVCAIALREAPSTGLFYFAEVQRSVDLFDVFQTPVRSFFKRFSA